MKFIAMTLGIGAAIAAVPASALSSGQAQQSQEGAPATPTVSVSKGAYQAISELQKAVDAKDHASVPAKLAAAEAAAKTQDDHYMVALLRLRGAAGLEDPAAIEQALASPALAGRLPTAAVAGIHADVGRLYLKRKQYDPAGTAIERALALEPGNVERTLLLAEVRNSQGRAADAVAMVQKAIAQLKATGQRVDENWYKRSVAFAFAGKLPNTLDLTREWLKAYPTPQNWRDALQVYRQTRQLDDTATIDVFRLARATRSLRGEADYYTYAEKLLQKGFPGEAKAVLEEGFAASAINRNKTEFAQLAASATTRSAGDRASLDPSAKTALAATTARMAIASADAYYGYGEFAKAAELYRAALGKVDVDKDLVNLRLGMALARAGDKAGATAALNAVTGPRSEIAGLWLVYLSTSA